MRYGQLLDLRKCIGCGACVMACKTENGTPHHVYWNTIHYHDKGEYPDCTRVHMPKACMLCSNAPCVENCPTGASHYNDYGVVMVNYDRCIGCGMCITACPYGARHYNMVDPTEDSYWGDGFDATPNQVARADRNPKGAVSKCRGCYEHVRDGEAPRCVHTCLTEARVWGDLDDPESDISKKIKELDAKPYHPEFGTKPSFYYVGLEDDE